MQRVGPATIAGLVAVGLIGGPAMAQDEQLDRIDLPNGWQPEGVTTDGTHLFAGSLADGAILRADPMTGTTEVLVEGTEGAVVAGLEHDAYGRLWAAGAPTGEVRAYDAATGELLATYAFESGFLNDVAATPDAIYVTDSFLPQVLVIPLGDDGALPDPEAGSVLPISGDLVYGEGFNLNGIVAAPGGLVVVHSGEGQLYNIDPASGAASRIDTGDVSLTGGDGLELDGRTLHVVRNSSNLVVTMELDEDALAAAFAGEATSLDFDVPTTAALVGDALWAVNARFSTDPTPETEYWITRVDAVDSAEG